jgi:hypothetical protein
MEKMFRIRIGILPALVGAAFALGYPAGASTVVQTVNDSTTSDWNLHAIWGSPAAVAAAGNDYVTSTSASGAASSSTGLGVSVSARVRDTGVNPFAGNSLTIVSGTELLLKNNATTTTGNITLNGGVVRYAPSGGSQATLAGTLNVAAESYLGLAGTVNETLTVNSALTGSGTLHVAAGNTANATQAALTVSFGGDLAGFTGIFSLGGGTSTTGSLNAILDFNQNYSLPSAGLTMGQSASADVLNLDQNIGFGSFTFGATKLGAGTYTASDLNGLFGNGSQFTGTGTLTILVPEPSALAVLATGFGLLVARWRRQ